MELEFKRSARDSFSGGKLIAFAVALLVPFNYIDEPSTLHFEKI